ncbi:hypothetical protein [Foetidibacter luteolus]|uniref:hypothetical protein n=1 Tax=Foetidibacter luteolus TaxID=2608880 RepID=UPI00129BFFD7|nr:hypothetical protein [Foetidibacter luteolus]
MQIIYTAYITDGMSIAVANHPMTATFIQWGNSFILDKETKIPITVAIAFKDDGRIILANPLGLVFVLNL